jgi:catechol 2,3-dioxygenase-like lactoylglutathione lyase family enzyme
MSEPVSPVALPQITIVVRDMQRSIAFYRLLGVSIDEVPAEWAE